jgi:hypothetical protein
MIYGDDDSFVCHDCGDECPLDEMAEADHHDGMALCGWCAEDWENNR